MPKTIKRRFRKTAKGVKKRQTGRYKRGGMRVGSYKLWSASQLTMSPEQRVDYLYKKFIENASRDRAIDSNDTTEFTELAKTLNTKLTSEQNEEKKTEIENKLLKIRRLQFPSIELPSIDSIAIRDDDAENIQHLQTYSFNRTLLEKMYQRILAHYNTSRPKKSIIKVKKEFLKLTAPYDPALIEIYKANLGACTSLDQLNELYQEITKFYNKNNTYKVKNPIPQSLIDKYATKALEKQRDETSLPKYDETSLPKYSEQEINDAIELFKLDKSKLDGRTLQKMFLNLSLKNHPDKGEQTETEIRNRTEIMKKINGANDILRSYVYHRDNPQIQPVVASFSSQSNYVPRGENFYEGVFSRGY